MKNSALSVQTLLRFAVVSSVVMAGCGVVSNMEQAQEASTQIAEAIHTELDAPSVVSVDLSSSAGLVSCTVRLEVAHVATREIGELHRMLVEIVKEKTSRERVRLSVLLE